MTSDVEDLKTFYTDLPSIFENNSTPSSSTLIDEQSYQPIFGSFLLADSDPISQTAFVVSSPVDQPSLTDETNLLSSIQTTPLSVLPSSNMDDIDEDDFDGIPIRHSSITIEKKLNGELEDNTDQQFNRLIQCIEHSLHEDHDMEDETFLNGFTDDEQRQETTTGGGSTFFKDIPDIDDPNPPDDDVIPFDHMDLSDQSDSIRSSSPDSLLSSSHLQDEHDDIDVEQWNDEHLLETTTPSKSQPSINDEHAFLNLPNHPFDQVDFIDSSRSHSRCSNASSHLSGGYADQARQFLSDDELMSSSDTDNNDDDQIDHSDTKNEDEEICLQVNLDDHHSISSSSESDSLRSTPSIPDQTPIVHIDSNDQEIAPIAALDDEDDDEMFESNISPPSISFSSHSLNFVEIKRNELVHQIVNMRHLFHENDHDDEFLAIMHNPKIFEDILHEDLSKVRTNEKRIESFLFFLSL